MIGEPGHGPNDLIAEEQLVVSSNTSPFGASPARASDLNEELTDMQGSLNLQQVLMGRNSI